MTSIEPALLQRLAAGQPPDAALLEAGDAERDQAGWALKAACHDAWSTDPARVPLLAGALRRLTEAAPTPLLRALTSWTDGLARAVEGDMVAALASFDDARARLLAVERPGEAAQTLVPKVMALAMLGRHDEALACAAEARAAFLATGDRRSAAKVELNLASMLLRQERYAESATHYRLAAVSFARLADTEHSVMADIGLATALSWQFEFDQAASMLERARMRAQAHALPVLAALARGSLGQLELHRGHLLRALQELEASARALGSAGSPQRHAEAERALADAYLALNLWPEAQALLQHVIATAQALDAPIEQARAQADLAHALAQQGQAAPARAHLHEALVLFEAQGNRVGAALVKLRRAELAMADSDADAALEDAQDAAAAFDAAGVHGWQHEAQAVASAALAQRGGLPLALSRLEAGRADAAARDLPDAVGAYDAALAGLWAAVGRPAQAREAAWRAVRHFDRRRAALPGDELRSRFGADKQAAYDLLVQLAADAPGADDGDCAIILLQAIEHGRAPALGLSLQARPVGAADDSPPARPDNPHDSPHGTRRASAGTDTAPDDPAVQQARTRWRWLHHQWQQALLDAGDGPRTAELGRLARQSEQALLEVLRRRLVAGSDPHEGTRPDGSAAVPLDAASLQRTLPPGTAMLVYHLDGPRWVACVVTAGSVRRLQGDATGLASELASARFQIDALRSGTAPLGGHLPQLTTRCRIRLHALYRRLVAPLEQHIEGCTRLVVVPHRQLHGLPWCALHDGRGWLIERFEIALAASPGTWQAWRLAGAAAAARLVAVAPGEGLPHSRDEARALAGLWAGDARLLVGGEAGLDRLRAAAAEADVLHLACHGCFRADNPAFSTLRLADGDLTMLDASALPIRKGALVTLSACESASGSALPGDEVIGLVRGFQMAGAATVVGTLWTVDDACTSALMTGFYSRIRGGDDVTKALAGAQREAARDQAHPYHWAAFHVYGHG